MTDLLSIRGQTIWVMAKGFKPDEGGMQTYAEGVATAFSEAGARVVIFTQTSAGPRRQTVAGMTLVDIGAGKSPMVPVRLLSAMRNELKRKSAPLFVHGTTWRTSILPMLLGLPYVTTFHGREFMYASGFALKLMRRVARVALRIVAVSEYSAAQLDKRLGEESQIAVVAWNGLSTWHRPVRRAHETPLLFSLCRLEPRKNILACVYACKTLRDEGLDFRYVIAGRGPQLEAIQAAVAEHQLQDVVEVAGFVSSERAAQLYADADIFLHPQLAGDDGRDFEGFGIAIADAMVSGTAVIVGEEGGAKELVKTGISGLVVDGRNSADLVANIRNLLIDPQKRSAIGMAAKERAMALFTWEKHIAILLKELRVRI